MPIESDDTFGEQLFKFCHPAGLSQKDLAGERAVLTGSSYAVVRNAGILPPISRRCSQRCYRYRQNQLTRFHEAEENRQRHNHLPRRFRLTEELPLSRTKEIMQAFDAFLEDRKLGKAPQT